MPTELREEQRRQAGHAKRERQLLRGVEHARGRADLRLWNAGEDDVEELETEVDETEDVEFVLKLDEEDEELVDCVVGTEDVDDEELKLVEDIPPVEVVPVVVVEVACKVAR